jgi:hypothetical protein
MKKNNEKTLFKPLPLRRKNGKYCNKEQYRQEIIEEDNKRLRYERDKYMRAWLAAANKASKLEREILTLKAKIGELV